MEDLSMLKKTGAVVFLFCLFLTGCEKESGAVAGRRVMPQEDALLVATSIFPPYDFVRAIAGDRVKLTMLLPPGGESHSFDPSPQDIILMQKADIFIYGGGESDAWVRELLTAMDTRNMRIIAMMDAVEAVEEEIVEGMQAEDEEEPAYDEHVWTSPRNAKLIMQAIADALCGSDPANAGLYRQNADAYLKSLEELDKGFQEAVNAGVRKTIVFGDRFPFRYFADAYGLTYFAAFPGCSTETEPSAATVAFLINKMRAEHIPAVFHIELSNEKMADTISEETGAKKLLFHACHNISKKDFEQGRTYMEFMTQNLTNLREALR
jgi:zinc transport system substrate-binding protein